MKENLFANLSNIEENVKKLSQELEPLDFKQHSEEIKRIKKQLSVYQPVVDKFKAYKTLLNKLKENEKQLSQEKDAEFISLLKQESKEIETELIAVEQDVLQDIIPEDPNDTKNTLIEMRGAAGGDEANIFVADLFTAYTKFCENKNLEIEIVNSSESQQGGFSQLEFLVKGKNAFAFFKYESGVHRVQRVPKTESKGRVHTSTIQVAVLAEASDVEVNINPKDLVVNTYRASGAGGQHVNKTDSAVRITHTPSGIVVTSQDGRSQHDNRDKAMRLLKTKLLEAMQKDAKNKENELRLNAIGKGDRSEKIRTYNYPQNRVTDHRIKLSINRLDSIMQGDFDEIIKSLNAYYRNEQINGIS